MDIDKNIILDKDVSLSALKGKKIAVIGYGNQGRAQALNLNDTGLNIVVGLRDNSQSIKQAKKDGIKVFNISKAVEWADLICLLVPDKNAPEVYSDYINPYLNVGQTLLFSHGYNIYYKKIFVNKNINVIMVAPSGGGALVRKKYQQAKGIDTILAVEQNHSL